PKNYCSSRHVLSADGPLEAQILKISVCLESRIPGDLDRGNTRILRSFPNTADMRPKPLPNGYFAFAAPSIQQTCSDTVVEARSTLPITPQSEDRVHRVHFHSANFLSLVVAPDPRLAVAYLQDPRLCAGRPGVWQ